MTARQDVGPGAQAALQELADARRQSREALAQVRRFHEFDIESTTFGDSPASTPHSAVFAFYDAVRPYRLGAPSLWNEEEIVSFGVAPPGQTGEVVTIHGLLELDRWRNRQLTYECEEEAPGNTTASRTVTRTERVWLPVRALQTVHDALADTLVAADLAAQIPPQDTEVETL
jgi:hypothetical protein